MEKVLEMRASRVLWLFTGCGLLLAAARELAMTVGSGWEVQTARGYANDCAQRARLLAAQDGELAR